MDNMTPNNMPEKKKYYPRDIPSRVEGLPEIRVEDPATHEKLHPEDYAALLREIANPPQKMSIDAAVSKALQEQGEVFNSSWNEREQWHETKMGQLKSELAAQVERAVADETKRCTGIVEKSDAAKAVVKKITDAFYGIAPVAVAEAPKG